MTPKPNIFPCAAPTAAPGVQTIDTIGIEVVEDAEAEALEVEVEVEDVAAVAPANQDHAAPIPFAATLRHIA